MEQGSTGNLFRGAGEQAYSFEDLGSPAKREKKIKNLTFKEWPHFCLIFFKKVIWLLGAIASISPCKMLIYLSTSGYI